MEIKLLSTKKNKIIAASVLGVFIIGGVSAYLFTKKETPVAKAPPSKPLIKKVLGKYSDAWDSFNLKAHQVRTALAEREKIELENTNLRLQLEQFQFDCTKREHSSRSAQVELRLTKETGSVVGRTLSSIHYRPPSHLLPVQLYTLGVSYFKAREDEKAAVVLTFVTGLEDYQEFSTPRDFMMTGIAWYRLDNFEVADHYFEKALNSEMSAENLPVHAQSRLWRALVAQKIGNAEKAQTLLVDLIDHHPHAPEAGWINRSRELLPIRSREKGSVIKLEVENKEKGHAPASEH